MTSVFLKVDPSPSRRPYRPFVFIGGTVYYACGGTVYLPQNRATTQPAQMKGCEFYQPVQMYSSIASRGRDFPAAMVASTSRYATTVELL